MPGSGKGTISSSQIPAARTQTREVARFSSHSSTGTAVIEKKREERVQLGEVSAKGYGRLEKMQSAWTKKKRAID